MTQAKRPNIYLGFKFKELYSPFVSVKWRRDGLTIVEDGLLWKGLMDATDAHINYPSNGNVHYTFRKADVYAVHVYKNATSITSYSSSHAAVELDYNALALRTLPLKLMVQSGPAFADFGTGDVYRLPTISFAVQPEIAARASFSDKVLKAKYGLPIDLTEKVGHLINVFVSIGGSKEVVKVGFPGIVHQLIAGEGPFVGIAVSSHINPSG